MILHLLWDEKITSRIIETFDSVFKNQNEYVFWWHTSDAKHFAYKSIRCHIIKDGLIDFEIDYSSITRVVIHGLDPMKVDFCKRFIPYEVPVFWILWGTELYNNLLYKKGYKLYYGHTPRLSLRGRIGKIIRKIGFKSKSDEKILDFFKTYDVTMVCAKEEYDLLRTYYPEQTKTLHNRSDFFYYPVDQILGKHLMSSKVNGNIILIGNSASWTNNHSYVFKYLKNLNLSNRKIVAPLSYGGDKEYREKVTTLGMDLFGNKFISLRDFIELEEYNKLMVQSEICIYGSWRQEAWGNIVIALYLGAKVFLSENNPLYTILQKKGFHIYKLEDINQDDLDIPISRQDQERNRAIVSQYNWQHLKKITFDTFN